MIVSALCAPLFLLVSGIIALIPSDWFSIGDAPTNLFSMLYTAFKFFPSDVWILTLGSITFWITIHFAFAAINFILKIVPLLSMGE